MPRIRVPEIQRRHSLRIRPERATAALMPVLIDFAETGLVARQPTLIVAGAAIAFGFGLVATGMILDRITRLRLEMARLLYLASTSPNALSDSPPK